MEDFGVVGGIYYKSYFSNINSPLVIAFSPESSYILEDNVESSPDPWAFSYICKQGLNALCFTPVRGKARYYRDPEFRSFLEKISTELDRKEFPEILSYGASMGGYAASAYANLLNVNRMLLFNPISTRKRSLAPWDYNARRSPHSWGDFWDESYSDGADANASGYIIYDPLFELDKLHAKRYKNLEELYFIGGGHTAIAIIKNIGMLDPVFKQFVSGVIDKDFFYKVQRKKKKQYEYYINLIEKNNYLTAKRRNLIDYYRVKEFSGFSFHGLSKKDIDLIRDSALILEKIGGLENLEASYKLMMLAHQLRPSGPLIKSKLSQLEKSKADILNNAEFDLVEKKANSDSLGFFSRIYNNFFRI